MIRANREYRAVRKNSRRSIPSSLLQGAWEKAHSDDYENGENNSSLLLQCVQCHAVNRTGLERRDRTLTLYGLSTSLAAGWMRNDEESLSKWLKNSNESQIW